MPARPQALLVLLLLTALLMPSAALAQSAGDEQYTDPFGGDGQQEQQQSQTQEPEQPAQQPTEQPPGTVEPTPGGNGTAEAAQERSPTLPRTGGPVLLFAATGYVFLLAGIAIRRKA